LSTRKHIYEPEGILGKKRFVYRVLCSGSFEDEYEIEKELGKGGFGVVFAVKHKKLGFPGAVKIIPKAGGNREEILNEIFALMDLDHPHIVKLSRYYDRESNVMIVSELCKGPDLFDRIVGCDMTESDAGIVLGQMLKAVMCVHTHYMGHYDIKPENFMYTTPECDTLKMIDLGLSSGFQRAANEIRGTVVYSAPEVWQGTFGPEADIWSCGVILFVMVTGESFLPMDREDDEVREMLRDRKWVRQRLEWASTLGLSQNCLDMLKSMLCYDRHMRISALDALRHPFIQGTHVSALQQQECAPSISILNRLHTNFLEFREEPALKQASLLMMAHIAGYCSLDARPHRRAFRLLDKVGYGELSCDALETTMNLYVDAGLDWDDAFKGIDLENNGYVSFGEFLAATLPQSLRSREDLNRLVFDLFDQDKDGFISMGDIVEAFLDKHDQQDEDKLSQCRQLIAETSNSNRMGVEFDTFFAMMKGAH